MNKLTRELIEPFLTEEEKPKIKKVVGIYGGRFQPFGPHHYATYKWLEKRVDDAYITTSNIKKPPLHPMNYREKVRHMTKMGIPKSKIIEEKTPYVANNTLKKYDSDTTAVVYIFGKKDAGRLVGGKKKSGGLTYYQDFKKNKNNLYGFEDHGYILTAPHVSVSAGGKEVSGTTMRKLLGSPKFDDSERQKLFKKMFGYYDKGVYQMMTNKFSKLFEDNDFDAKDVMIYNPSRRKKRDKKWFDGKDKELLFDKELIKKVFDSIGKKEIDEFLTTVDMKKLISEATNTTYTPTDDGPPTFYKTFSEYKKYSKKWIDDMYEDKGWEVLGYILSQGAEDPEFDFTMKYNVVPAVAYGKKGSGKYGSRFGVKKPVKKYMDRLKKVIRTLGWEVVKWSGLTDDLKNVTGVEVEAPVLAGVGKINKGETIRAMDDVEKTKSGRPKLNTVKESHIKLFTPDWWKNIIIENWWTDMSSQEQEDYIEKHPKSKKAQSAKKTTASKTKMPKFDMPKIKMPKIKLDPKKLKKAAEKQASKRSARDMSVKERKHELSFISNRSQKIKPIIKKLNNLHDEYDKIFLPLQEKYEKAESAGNTQESERLLKQIEEMSKEHDEKVKPYLKAEEEFWELEDREKELKYSPPIKRKSKLKKRKDGGKIEMLDEEGIKHIWYNKDNPKDPTQEKTLKHLDKQWKDSPLSKLSEKEKATTYDYIASWKGLGAYEARERLGDKYVNKRNSHMNELAGKSIIQTPPPKEISRGMTLKKHKVKRMLEKYKVGSDVNLDFPQGFTGTSTISTSFGNPPSDEDVSFVIKIKPNSKGQIRGLHIDGITNDSDYKKYADKSDEREVSNYDSLHKFKEEQEIIRSSDVTSKVVDLIERKGKGPKGEDLIYYEIILQESEDLKESIIKEGIKFEEDALPVAPKRIANIIEKDFARWGKLYFAEPNEGDTRIRLYKDNKLRKPFKVKIVDTKLVYRVSKYKKFLSRKNNIVGKMRINENIDVKEDIKPDVIKSFIIRNSLNQKLWDGHSLKPEIRKKLLVIANNFFKELELDVKLHDVTLTGSISNYNWSKFSDVDLHLRIKFSEVDENIDLVNNYVLSKKGVWNEKHDITIFGFPVEVYVENVGESHVASGLYSILNDKWIVEPKKKELQIDLDDIRTKAEGYLSYTAFLKKYMKNKQYDKVIAAVDKIKEKLKRMRSSGLARGGEFSVENLAFKALRRSPFIADITKMKTDAYDKMMTMNGSKNELFSKGWWKKLLLEGGAYGHMNHPFDDKNLTFNDFRNIIDMGLQGNLDREENVTEKTDGQNLMVTWKNGKLRAARNKGQLKDSGKNSLDAVSVARKFKGRGDIRNAFVYAMTDLGKSIKSLSDKQKEKIFNEGEKFMNLEIIYPASSNVINYDVAVLQFHGTLKYNKDGTPIGHSKGDARTLEGMIRQVNQHVQKHFKIVKPQFLTVPAHQDYSKKRDYFFGRLKKLQDTYMLTGSQTLSEYHQAFWEEFVYNAAKQFDYTISNKVLMGLVKRWAFFDKSYKINDIKKDIDNEKFLSWVLSFDKNDHAKYVKSNMLPFEKLFFELGSVILKNAEGFLAVSPKSTVQKIKKTLSSSIKTLQKGGDIKKLKKLNQELSKIQAMGGFDSIVPSEGLVFKYKGNYYKFTGAFAPINQITGMLAF